MTIKEKLIPDKKVCILGLGYVGLTLAVTLCEIGYEVFGVEINEKNLRKLKQGKAHFLETGLDGRLSSVVKSKKLKLFKNIHQKFGVSVYIVTVGTPINQYDQVNSLMMKNVCEEISRFLKKGDLIILRSTVEVGTTEKMKNEVFDKSNDNIIKIESTIIVERETQKGILIGKNGVALKRVGIEARKKLEKFFKIKVHLKLFVKVNKKWRTNLKKLKDFGYN